MSPCVNISQMQEHLLAVLKQNHRENGMLDVAANVRLLTSSGCSILKFYNALHNILNMAIKQWSKIRVYGWKGDFSLGPYHLLIKKSYKGILEINHILCWVDRSQGCAKTISLSVSINFDQSLQSNFKHDGIIKRPMKIEACSGEDVFRTFLNWLFTCPVLRTVPPNTDVFLQRLWLWGEGRLSEGYWNPKRRVWITMHTFFRDN